jgi:hypothetical protein
MRRPAKDCEGLVIEPNIFEFSMLLNISGNRWKVQWPIFHILGLFMAIDGKFSIP